jgi:hypothetical protein
MAARKLCPTCGERYPAEILYCPRDGAALAIRAEDAAAGVAAALSGGAGGGATRALTLDAETKARMDAGRESAGGARGGSGLSGAGLAIVLLGLLSAQRGHAAESAVAPIRAPDERTETYGTAEVGLGMLTLPGAEVCVERSGAGCSQGDQSLVVSGWPMFRRGSFAVGAGVSLALIPTTDAPRNDPPDLPRDHARSYLTVELTGRYYVPFSDDIDGWAGVTAGMVMVKDNFQTQRGLTEQALVGPRGSTILTEGGTLGIAAGVGWTLSPTWVVGGHLHGANWFLPERPETNPLGDEASLQGNVITVGLYLTLAYRSRLVF